MKSVNGRRPTPIVSDKIAYQPHVLLIAYRTPLQLNLRALVQDEINSLFHTIDNEEFTFSDIMNTRELIHLQDYQKMILSKNFLFLKRFVKLKMEQYLSIGCSTQRIERPSNSFCCHLSSNFVIQFTHLAGVNREQLVLQISKCLLIFPVDCIRLTRNIRTISRIISAEIHDAVQIAYVLGKSLVP